MSKKIVEFEAPRTWKIADREVEVKKIETNTYVASLKLPKHKSKIDVISPAVVVHNVIKNVALLQNGTFIELDKDTVLARINDVVGTTLIRTEWKINVHTFNDIVYRLQYQDSKIPETAFHVISKVS